MLEYKMTFICICYIQLQCQTLCHHQSIHQSHT